MKLVPIADRIAATMRRRKERDDDYLAEVERLRAALKRIANHPDARDSIVSIAATELDEQIAASE
jgi:thymidylate synthase